MTCEVTVNGTGTGPAQERRRVVFTAQVAEDCKSRAQAGVEARKRSELEPLEQTLAGLAASGSSSKEWDLREAELQARFQASLAALDARERSTAEKAEAEIQELRQVSAEAVKEQAGRIS